MNFKAGSYNDINASMVRYEQVFKHPKMADKDGEGPKMVDNTIKFSTSSVEAWNKN